LPTAWDDHWGTPQQIISRLAENNRVLVLELPVSPLSPFSGLHKGTWTRQIRRWWQGSRQSEKPRLTIVSPPPVLPFRYHKLTNRLTQNILLRCLESVAKRLDFKNPLLITFQADSGALVRRINARVKIYCCLDDWSATGRRSQPAEKVRQREMELVEACDLIFATSRRLACRLEKFGKPTFFIPNAADFRLFSQAQGADPPQELSVLKRPIIGFVGMITPHSFDADLISWLAERHPEWTIAIVGKKLARDPDLRMLEKLPNLHFFGFQPLDLIPRFLSAMDVCLIPLRQTPWIKSSFSLKLFEYLGAGKPVVSTWNEEFLPYRNIICVTRTYDEFEQCIAKSIHENTPELVRRRMGFAQENTWDGRVAEFSKIVQGFLDGPRDSGFSVTDAANIRRQIPV
jgi:glycosyltransferase involved in cell wall biosynthesis